MRLKKQGGNAIVEFALVLPVLILILAGIIEFSVITYDKAVVTSASREGARYGVVFRTPTYPSVASIKSYTLTYCTNKLITFGSPTAAVVTVTAPTTPKFGDQLTVNVSYTYTVLLLNRLMIFNPTLSITSTTVMTYE